jgi:hypothetical protein
LDFIRQYEVKPNLQSQENKSKKNNSLKEEEMNTLNEKQTEDGKPLRYNEAMINWKQLEQFGISRDYLKGKGLLDEMLKGYKTSRLVPITANFGSAVLRTDARLSFQQSKEGVVLAMHGIRKEPEFKPYFGYHFSDEDIKNLKETGNMGRLAMIAPQGSSEKAPYFISIDKMTNEIVGARADRVFIKDEVSGVKLTDAEKEILRKGKAIFVEGMISSRSGKDFKAHLQIDANTRGIGYIFEKDGQFNKEEIGCVKLTQKQLEDFHTGKTIFVEDMTAKSGRVFSSFLKLDNNGNPQYLNYNPDTGEIYVPKVIRDVPLTPEDRETLRAGKPVFLENMTGSDGQDFSRFVKIDTETGKISYSKTLDGFDEKPAFKLEPEVWGHTFTATERAQLQDGKAVHVTGMKGFEGQDFSSWLKINTRMGHLDYFTSNPDQPRQNVKQPESITAQKKIDKEPISRETTQRPISKQRKIA